MSTYTNHGHTMATVIFTDGDGFILKRGEKRRDGRQVAWIDKTVRVTTSAVAQKVETKDAKVSTSNKEEKSKVLNKE